MSRWIFHLKHESKRAVKYAENDKECSFEVGLPGVILAISQLNAQNLLL